MTDYLHPADFFGCIMQQTKLLRAGRLTEIDREHLAEEIEDMGRSLQRELADSSFASSSQMAVSAGIPRQ